METPRARRTQSSEGMPFSAPSAFHISQKLDRGFSFEMTRLTEIGDAMNSALVPTGSVLCRPCGVCRQASGHTPSHLKRLPKSSETSEVWQVSFTGRSRQGTFLTCLARGFSEENNGKCRFRSSRADEFGDSSECQWVDPGTLLNYSDFGNSGTGGRTFSGVCGTCSVSRFGWPNCLSRVNASYNRPVAV